MGSYIQSGQSVTASAVTSRTPTLPVAATPGSGLVAFVSIDKNAGTFNAVPGWDVLYSYTSGAVSHHVIGKEATGGETSVTLSWTDAHPVAAVIIECAGPINWAGRLANSANSGASTVTSQVTGDVSATGSGIAIATLAIDSQPAQATWSNSFTVRQENGPTANPGYSAATKVITGAGTVNSTATFGSPDETVAGVVFIPDAGGFDPTQQVDDTGTGSDASSGAYAATPADSGSGTDAVTGALDATVADSATGTDALAAQHGGSAEESGTGSDTAGAQYVAALDETASGTDALSAQLGAAADETGTGADAVTGALSAQVDESGTGIDTAAGALSAQVDEAASGSDALAAQHAAGFADIATGADAVSAVPGAALAESGIGLDSISALFAAVVPESASGADTASGNLPSAAVPGRARLIDLRPAAELTPRAPSAELALWEPAATLSTWAPSATLTVRLPSATLTRRSTP